MRFQWAMIALAAFAVSAAAQTAGNNSSVNTTGPANSAVSQTSSAAVQRSGAAEATSSAAHAEDVSASAEQATNISARLTRSLDTKNAKVGEEVIAKTTSNARLADGTRLPKNSRLIGHVTDVEAKSHANEDSRLAFAFDHAVLRDGREVPIHAVMESIVAPAPLAAGSGDMMADGGMGGGGAMAGGGMRGGGGGLLGGGGVARGGSGLVGGAAGAVSGTTGAVGGAAGATASGLGSSANGAMNSTASLGRNTAALSGAAEGNAALSGRVLPVGNLSGVTFSTVTASGSASRSGINGSAGSATATMLSAHGKNFALDSGSQMTLSVSPQ